MSKHYTYTVLQPPVKDWQGIPQYKKCTLAGEASPSLIKAKILDSDLTVTDAPKSTETAAPLPPEPVAKPTPEPVTPPEPEPEVETQAEPEPAPAAESDDFLTLINAMEAADLIQLPGIGNAKAQQVLSAQPLASIDAFKRIVALGPDAWIELVGAVNR